MRNVAIAALGAAVLGVACAIAVTAPKPSDSAVNVTPPKPSDVAVKWELDFTFDAPRPILLPVPGEAKPVTFWYVVYTVTNHTPREQDFMPDFVLYTDTGQILRSGQGVPGMVFREIKKAINQPLLIDQADLSSKPLLRGDDNAKQGLMIFTDLDAQAGSFDIFVCGLSGETVKIRPPNPVPTVVFDANDQRQIEMAAEIVLSKTLQLTFSLPGEAAARFRTAAALQQKKWVMR